MLTFVILISGCVDEEGEVDNFCKQNNWTGSENSNGLSYGNCFKIINETKYMADVCRDEDKKEYVICGADRNTFDSDLIITYAVFKIIGVF